jgi:hypothetical protein
MTKKKVLVGGLIGLMFFIYSTMISIQGMCLYKYVCNRSHDDSLMAFFLPFLPLFLFSLITYFLKEETFQSWWRFARIATPLSMFLIFLAPSYSHDFMFPIEKGTVATGTSFLFALISIIILASSHWKAYGK